jgi:two-component system chemotaxis response regulator CheY
MSKKILSLGQCGADNYTLTQFLETSFATQVVPADTFDEALAQLRAGTFDLVLVNRVLDVNGASGLGFIGQLKADPELAGTPMMLVSNYADAQREAVALGALMGFGKAGLDDPGTTARLRGILGKA